MQKFTAILLILIPCFINAQPILSIGAAVGPWREWPPESDGYASQHQHWHFSGGAWAGIEIPISNWAAFSTEAGIDGLGLNVHYSTTRSSRTVDARLKAGYGRISPAFLLRMGEVASVSAGFTVMGRLLAGGNFGISTYDNGSVTVESFRGRLNEVLKPILWGFNLGLGADAPLQNGNKFGFRITTFWGENRMLNRSLVTPYNPRLAHFRVGFAYIFHNRVPRLSTSQSQAVMKL